MKDNIVKEAIVIVVSLFLLTFWRKNRKDESVTWSDIVWITGGLNWSPLSFVLFLFSIYLWGQCLNMDFDGLAFAILPTHFSFFFKKSRNDIEGLVVSMISYKVDFFNKLKCKIIIYCKYYSKWWEHTNITINKIINHNY